MADFVDPRTHPRPSVRPSGSELAESLDQLEALIRFCQEGRVYEVEAWTAFYFFSAFGNHIVMDGK